MNQKLVHLYLEGLQKGYITYTEEDMALNQDGDVFNFALQILDAEAEAYFNKVIYTTHETRKLPEFKEAVKLFESPLSEALK